MVCRGLKEIRVAKETEVEGETQAVLENQVFLGIQDTEDTEVPEVLLETWAQSVS